MNNIFFNSSFKYEPITLKIKNFNLLVLYIHNTKPDIIYQAIKNKIIKFPYLLKNTPVALNISLVSLHIKNWIQIKNAILLTGLKIIGVIGCQDKTLEFLILKTGMPLLYTQNKKKTKKIFKKSQIISHPVRSGQKIYARNTDLIIINNVSSGAELVSEGNIHIYGIMRGRALAGASGNTNCQIFCTYLYAELISIAGKYWSMEQIPVFFNKKSVRFFLKNGLLKIQKIN